MQANPLPLRSPEARLSAATAELVRRLRLLERRELDCCGLSPSQAMVLRSLAGARLRMSDLAARLGVAQSTATRLVEPLVRRALVARRPAADDARAIEVALTEEGRHRSREAALGALRFNTRILARVPAERRERVVSGLETLAAAVAECCDGCCAS